MIIGILALAMPITVLGNNFNAQFLANRHREYEGKQDIFRSISRGLKSYHRRSTAAGTLREVEKELIEVETAKMATVQEMLGESRSASPTLASLSGDSLSCAHQ